MIYAYKIKSKKGVFMKILINLLIALIPMAAAAATLAVFIDIIGPGIGIMDMAVFISWTAVFVGISVFFILRAFLNGRFLPGLFLAIFGIGAAVFAGMALADQVSYMPNASAMQALTFIVMLGSFPALVVSSLVGLVGLGQMFSRRRQQQVQH